MSSTPFFRRVEFYFLLGLAVFLPALEAPKNICAGFFLIFWLFNRLREGDWGGSWTGLDSAILALIASGYAAAWFAGLPGRPLSAGNDILSYGLVFMAVRRTRFEARQIHWLLVGLVVGTLLTLAYGYWGYLVTQERRTLGLHSVGHVNHSAVYMAIVFCLALAAGFSMRLSGWRKWAVWGSALILFVSLLVTVARGAIAPTLIFIFLWGFQRFVRGRGYSVLKYFLITFAVLGVALVVRPEIVSKTLGNIDGGVAGSYRPSLARTALLAAREYPLFGVGPTQFGKISPELAQRWQVEHGRWFEDDDLYFASHAHGLYFNTLAERGMVGLLILLAVLGAWGVALKRGTPDDRTDELSATLWGAALGAWILTVVGGVFNTTLHHEHAMITALLIALWLSWQRLQKSGP